MVPICALNLCQYIIFLVCVLDRKRPLFIFFIFSISAATLHIRRDATFFSHDGKRFKDKRKKKLEKNFSYKLKTKGFLKNNQITCEKFLLFLSRKMLKSRDEGRLLHSVPFRGLEECKHCSCIKILVNTAVN